MLERGTDVNAKDIGGVQPLHAAAGHRLFAVMEKVIPCEGNFMAAHHVIENNRLEIVRLLMERGANVNSKDKNGYTPRCWAVEMGQTAVATQLQPNGGNKTRRLSECPPKRTNKK